MAIRPPVESDLAAVAERYGLELSSADIASFVPFASGLVSSWTAVEELYARTAPTPRSDRPWSRPAERDNPLGAWYVTTDIRETDGGPLAGRTVAIKDNIMVAGVPMMNGSETVEGFVPTATPRWSPACWPLARPSRARRCAKTCASPAAATRRGLARCATPGT